VARRGIDVTDSTMGPSADDDHTDTLLRTHDGLQLHVRAEGPVDAPVSIVLVHCWTSDHDSWRYQLRDLRARYGHAVRLVTYDHRGHGQSDPAPKDRCRIAHLGRDLGDVIDRYAPHGRLVLGGHSIGGMTVMELGLQRPELFEQRVEGLCLVATSGGELRSVTLGLPDIGPWVKNHIPYVLAFRSRTLSRKQRLRAPIIESLVVRRFLFGDTMRLRDHMLTVEGLVNVPGTTMTGFFEDLMEHERHGHLADTLRDIPTVVLVGDKDLLTPPEHARRLAQHIPGARLIISPGAGHMLPLERDRHVSDMFCSLVDPLLPTDPDVPAPGGQPRPERRPEGRDPAESAVRQGPTRDASVPTDDET
jgi:pimeloyl-ACP methyl ester carboxylesterase